MQKDNTNVFIETGDEDYVKEISKFSVGFSKSINFSQYYSKFPVSLRKESLFYQYNQYEIKTTTNKTIKENIVGVTLDTLFVHKLPVPITVKYITNDDMKDDYKVKVSFGLNY